MKSLSTSVVQNSCVLLSVVACVLLAMSSPVSADWADRAKLVELTKAFPNVKWPEIPTDQCGPEVEGGPWVCHQDLQHILELHLGNLNLSGTIPPVVYTFQSMIALKMDHNQLTGTISPDIASLNAALLRLNLNNNQLTGTIPVEIKSLFLDTLYLDHNQLEGSIPDETFGVNLLNVGLSYNRFSGKLPKSIGRPEFISNFALECNLGLDLCSETYQVQTSNANRCSVADLTTPACTQYWSDLQKSGKEHFCDIVSNCTYAYVPIEPGVEPTPEPVPVSPVPVAPSPPVPIEPGVEPTPEPVPVSPVPVAPSPHVPNHSSGSVLEAASILGVFVMLINFYI